MELCLFIQHRTIRQPEMIYQFEHLLVTVFVKKSISLISWECISLLCFHMTDRFIKSNFLKFYSEYLHFKKLSHFGAPLLANLVNSQHKVSQNNRFTQTRALICAVFGTTVPKSAHISAENGILNWFRCQKLWPNQCPKRSGVFPALMYIFKWWWLCERNLGIPTNVTH